MSRLIEAIGLTRRFGDLTAVDDVSFSVGKGEVVGLLGANGAGKTTTIRMLIGLLAPTSGRARLAGRRPDTEARRRLGYVPQGLGLYTDLTVQENLSFVAGAYGVEAAPLSGDLDHQRDSLIGDLPLGLQRQLAFACAIQHRPSILILDEPTSGVGPLSAAVLWDRIRSEAERGAGALVSTHSMEEARECDRLILMSSGAIAATGTETDIIGDTTAVLVSTSSWTDAFEALEAAGALVTLDGRNVRVANADAAEVERQLAAAGITASVASVPASLDEKMVALAT
jgi:ABC-type multidrug transport system ATPase subunit